ncbi:hypothetical protein [Granulicella sibirica]|uniref:hypothetical protein n=1 Tax=Granulicella sibirica TaxID=2479048 RepID=UPI0010090D3A|nr:hypothetical protein [Granulicella sibirica]
MTNQRIRTNSNGSELIRARFALRLSEIGFIRNGDWFVLRLSSDLRGLVSFNFAAHREDHLLGVCPIVSLEFCSIAKKLNELTDNPLSKVQPSLSCGLGYLMPEGRWLEWLFNPASADVDENDHIAQICEAIHTYGLPFFADNRSVDTPIENLIHHRFSFKDRASFHLPLAYSLRFQWSSALDLVRNTQSEMLGRTDEAAKSFRSFAQRFIDEISIIDL